MRLTPAQCRFIDEHIHGQDFWMCKAGHKIGCTPRTGRERRVMQAMIAKGALEENGHITNAGRDAWRKAARRCQP